MRRFSHTEGSSSKFWQIQVKGTRLSVTYGRQGTTGQTKAKECDSADAAKKEEHKLIAQKTSKGYVEVLVQRSQPAGRKKPGKAQPKAWNGRTPSKELLAFSTYHTNGGDDAFFRDPDYGEVRFIENEAAGTDTYLSSAQGAVYEALFSEIAWVGEEADGGLIGFFHGQASSMDDAPVVYLDNEGQLLLTGPTLVDHFAWRKLDELTALKEFATAQGLPAPRTEKARDKLIAKLPSPEKRFAEIEAQLSAASAKASRTKARTPAGSVSAVSNVRPLDRAPSVVKLNDGCFLVISSEDDVRAPKSGTNSVFLFDPQHDTFSLAAETPFKMYLNVSVVGSLRDGRAVVMQVDERTVAAIYDPRRDRWSKGRVLRQEHRDASAALTANDQIIVVGSNSGYKPDATRVSVYDPLANLWTTTSALQQGRSRCAAVSLPDGRVLVLGGESSRNYSSTALKTCEALMSKSKTSDFITSMPETMDMPEALRLADGRVLVGESNGRCTIYDAATNTWSAMFGKGKLSEVFVQLDNGSVVFFVGENVRMLDPVRLTIKEAGRTRLPRGAGRAVALPGNRVLLIGGTLFTNLAREPEIWDAQSGEGSAIKGFESQLKKQAANLAARNSRKPPPAKIAASHSKRMPRGKIS